VSADIWQEIECPNQGTDIDVYGAAATVRLASRTAMAKVFFIMSVPFAPTVQTFERCHLLFRTSS
jgi:hypothetical protein